MIGVKEFSQYDVTCLVSREILQVFPNDSIENSTLFPTKLPLIKHRITELEDKYNGIQFLFKEQLESKLPGIFNICKSDGAFTQHSQPPHMSYLDYMTRLNNAATNFVDYQNVQSFISNTEIINEISDLNSPYGLTLAIQYKNNQDILGRKSRERIIFEFKKFIDIEKELSTYLIESNNNSKLNINLRYLFIKKNDIWTVTNNSKRLSQFISNCLLSSIDSAIAKRIDIAIKPYILYHKIEITSSENPLKNVSISASQSLLALSRSLAFLTDLHLQIKALDCYISDFESYVSNRLLKWLNSLILSLTWDTKGIYDIVHMGLLTFYFVKLRSFLLPELASTVRRILGSNSILSGDENVGKSREEWREKLGTGSEYQVNPYKGWIPGKPFKGIHIPTTTSARDLSIIANSLKELFESID